ncbi:MotE family protein [Metabacillus halosaccharovorans]|uniref:MotE family protein n=1 Tax=Metabacillus halosaccharovorans TaxID=930124 RepID=UPI00203F6F85|nr:hypothetical protein [Metabacillus halosaccharovorans]MCM3441097.1 hypothetical protein [Metabacillus halosaccharovorans]
METEKQEYSKLQWFFFVIFIPVVFTLTLVLIILSVAGFDVIGKAKSTITSIPVVENLINKEKENPDESAIAVKEKETQEENKKLEKTIEEQATMISALESDVGAKEKEVQKLTQEISSLEKQIEEIAKAGEESQSRDIGKLYDNMSSKKAAEIIPNLSQDDALLILSSLDDKQVADILSKMSVEDAVKFTDLLSSNSQ